MNVDQFIHRCEKASVELESATRAGVNAGAAVLGIAANSTLAGATHGTLALRGVPGATLAAAVLPAASVVRPVALVAERPAGLAKILNAGTFPHPVGAGRGKVSTGTNKFGVRFATTKRGGNSYTTKLLTFGKGNGAAYGPFIAGGSPAHQTLDRAAEAAHPAIVEAMHATTMKAVLGSFK